MIRVGLRHVPFVLATIVICGALIGWYFEKAREAKAPLVLAGSGNVYPWFRDTQPDSFKDLNPLFLDIGSERALDQAFAAFDYGRLAKGGRVGFIVMSSNGVAHLADIVQQSEDNYFVNDNFWLAVIVTHSPMFVLYRNIGSQLSVKRSEDFIAGEKPVASGTYGFVSFSDVRDIIAREPKAVSFFLPEDGTATRLAFEKASTGSTKVVWPNDVEQVPDMLERFKGPFPILSLESYPQISITKPDERVCARLKEYNLKTAIVCSDGGKCSKPISIDFTLVFKVQREDANRFLITNTAECKIARSLDAGGVDSTCHIADQPKNAHIIVHDVSGSAQLPDYLSCTQ